MYSLVLGIHDLLDVNMTVSAIARSIVLVLSYSFLRVRVCSRVYLFVIKCAEGSFSEDYCTWVGSLGCGRVKRMLRQDTRAKVKEKP